MSTGNIDDLALHEILKLIFTIIHFIPSQASAFCTSIPPLLVLVDHASKQSAQPQPLHRDVINALMNAGLTQDATLPLANAGFFFPASDPCCHVKVLLRLLQGAIAHYPEAELDQHIIPLLTLVRGLHEGAPPSVRTYMRSVLLPADDERHVPVGKSDSFASALLRFSGSALAPRSRDTIMALLFELSDRNADALVRNIGYGHAAGFLLKQGLPVSAAPAQGLAADGVQDAGLHGLINPCTGQRLDAEAPDLAPPMTEEEKEREAERLFVLFERYVTSRSGSGTSR